MAAIGPGTQIGPYTIVALARRGSMSEVFLAVQGSTDRQVAVKALAAASEQARREAAAVTALSHPNIVTTYAVLEFEDRLCLVQEWMPSGSLERLLGSGTTLTVDETLQVGIDVASALAYAHGKGILHRDVKPSNVMFADSHFKLVDFGAVGRLENDSLSTKAGQIAGTPLYMAPEQFSGLPQTAATDLYSLGLVLLRCLHGELPGTEAGNFVDLYRSRAATTVAVPPSPLQDLLERCLAPDPGRRPQSAGEVLGELQVIMRAVRGEPVSAPAPPASVPADALVEHSGPLGVIAIAVVAALLGWGLIASGGETWRALFGVLAGVVVAAAGLAAAHRIRTRSTPAPDVQERAAGIVLGAGSREDLTQSLLIEVDQVVRNLETIDARFLGMSIVAMIREYKEGKDSADRQAALLNVVALMDKVQDRLSPWHVRHKDAIASGVAVAGCLAAVASAVGGFVA